MGDRSPSLCEESLELLGDVAGFVGLSSCSSLYVLSWTPGLRTGRVGVVELDARPHTTASTDLSTVVNCLPKLDARPWVFVECLELDARPLAYYMRQF